jgi:PKD repeat protein
MNRQVALAATMRFSRVFPLVAVAALLAACGDDDTGPSNTAPTAAFTVQCNPLTCTFTNNSTDADGTIEGYDWDFGDHGPHVTTRDADHTYAKPGGQFTVSLAVTDDDGAIATTTAYLVVSNPNVAPTARFTVSCTELTCDFTSQSFDAAYGTIEGYDWDFGDHSAHATTRDASHTYAEPGGQFTVSLAVTDDDGAIATATEQVDLAANVAPTALFGFSCTDLTCTFADGSTDADGTIEAYDWDFGDGQTSTEQNPEHSYAAAGTYVVGLTVTDSRDSTGNASRSLRVPPPPPHVAPTAAFTATCSELECAFTDQSIGEGIIWLWQFGDGAESQDQNPTHVYEVTEPTTFTVTLIVLDWDLAQGVVSHEVSVAPPE